MSTFMHNVFFKFAKNITEQQINYCMHQLKQLQKEIQEIKSMAFRINQSKEGLNKGFTHLIQMEFEDEASFLKYLHHTEHIKTVDELIAQQIIEVEQSLLIFDYLIP